LWTAEVDADNDGLEGYCGEQIKTTKIKYKYYHRYKNNIVLCN